MSEVESADLQAGACQSCQRRAWLVSALGGALEYRCRDRGRLIELLGLPDGELLDALAGRRRSELRGRYEAFQGDELAPGAGVEPVCRHRRRYPAALRQPSAPAMVNVGGGTDRLARLSTSPIVALLGSPRASDYGMEMAAGLGRSLAASGVTVASALTDGIAVAAQSGALAVQGSTIAVLGNGLSVQRPARTRALRARIGEVGCAISELPRDCDGRRWGAIASERILVELAGLIVVVEAEDCVGDLFSAQLALALGRTVAAVPGRVSSPLSAGAHKLILHGAPLVRGAQDILELLSLPATIPAIVPSDPRARPGPPDPLAALEPRLRAVLDGVGSGSDSAEKLIRRGLDAGEALLSLSELEVAGLLRRGDGGRYVVCSPRGLRASR